MAAELSPKSRSVLELLAKGHSYDQLMREDPSLSYFDLAQAASEALSVSQKGGTAKPYTARLAKIKESYPRAYERWTPAEESDLRRMFEAGDSPRCIARALKRQPSALRTRLVKLGLIAPNAGGDTKSE